MMIGTSNPAKKEKSMKTVHWYGLMLALFLVVPAAMSADLNEPHIVVYGTSTIQVVPNQMIWLLNVRNIDPSSAGAARAHETTVETVLDFLKKSQIAEEKIQTSRMQMGENWKYVSNERVQEGYFASTDVQFTLADLTRYSSVWIGLSELKGVQVSNVSLESSERIKYQNEARTNAVLAAKEKAGAIAGILGTHIGQPLIVEEDLSVQDVYRGQASITSNVASWAGSPMERSQSVAPGSIPVRARVKAIFSLPKK